MNAYSSGIDLHSDNNVICVVDQDGKIQFRRKLANELSVVIKVLEPFQDTAGQTNCNNSCDFLENST